MTNENKITKANNIITALLGAGAIFSVRSFVKAAGNKRLDGANVIEIFSREDADKVRQMFPKDFTTGLDSAQRRVSIARFELQEKGK